MSRSPAPRRRATLASLAAELKVSRTTISNAYNRPDQLSAELRERVLAAAKRLGYPGPDPVARSLRTRRAGAVGLVITEPLTYAFSDPAALNFVAGLAESCEEFGQGLLLVACGPERSVADGTNAVLSAGVDGFVVYAAADDHPYLQTALQRHLPVVIVDQPKNIPDASQVCIDDRAAMRGEGAFIIYSADENQTALDATSGDDKDPNSVFTRNFTRTLSEPGLNLVQIAKRCGARVPAPGPPAGAAASA